MPYETKVLSKWSEMARHCIGQPGYHPIEALVILFGEIYSRIEDQPELRTVGGKGYTPGEWASSGVSLALWLRDFGGFELICQGLPERACPKPGLADPRPGLAPCLVARLQTRGHSACCGSHRGHPRFPLRQDPGGTLVHDPTPD